MTTEPRTDSQRHMEAAYCVGMAACYLRDAAAAEGDLPLALVMRDLEAELRHWHNKLIELAEGEVPAGHRPG